MMQRFARLVKCCHQLHTSGAVDLDRFSVTTVGRMGVTIGVVIVTLIGSFLAVPTTARSRPTAESGRTGRARRTTDHHR